MISKRTKKIILLIVLMTIYLLLVIFKNDNTYYLSNDKSYVLAMNSDKQIITLPRGKKVTCYNKSIVVENMELTEIIYDDEKYYVKENNLTTDYNKICKEKVLYTKEDTTTYNDMDSINIKGLIKKAEEVNVLSHSELLDDGSVKRYETDKGCIDSKYLTTDKNEATKSNIPLSISDIDTDYYGGGNKGSLNYLFFEKPSFENNIMPEYVKAIYINPYVLNDIDSYISLAKELGINAFVVDIKDNGAVSYKSDVAKNESISTYNASIYSKEEYKSFIKKIKDNNIYVIGRITVFKDDLYANDHPDKTIVDNVTWMPLELGGSYWPNPYDRRVWEYNVKYALEAVNDFGFNEIQFDYVRFPEQVSFTSYRDIVAYYNEYNETHAQAIQRFLMYATDVLHANNVYVSCDVFGEVNNDYVTGYGQYYPAISNVVDVISPMPYPDHFSTYTYGIYSPWLEPYNLLTKWSDSLMNRHKETPSPAKIRCYIQGYDSTKYPYIAYDSSKLKEQIDALNEHGFNGYIIWNAASSIEKYNSYKDAIKE